jgi:hypothetical protein
MEYGSVTEGVARGRALAVQTQSKAARWKVLVVSLLMMLTRHASS